MFIVQSSHSNIITVFNCPSHPPFLKCSILSDYVHSPPNKLYTCTCIQTLTDSHAFVRSVPMGDHILIDCIEKTPRIITPYVCHVASRTIWNELYYTYRHYCFYRIIKKKMKAFYFFLLNYFLVSL